MYLDYAQSRGVAQRSDRKQCRLKSLVETGQIPLEALKGLCHGDVLRTLVPESDARGEKGVTGVASVTMAGN